MVRFIQTTPTKPRIKPRMIAWLTPKFFMSFLVIIVKRVPRIMPEITNAKHRILISVGCIRAIVEKRETSKVEMNEERNHWIIIKRRVIKTYFCFSFTMIFLC